LTAPTRGCKINPLKQIRRKMKTLTIKIKCTDIKEYPRAELDAGKYKFASITTEEPICYDEKETGKDIWYIAKKAHEHAKIFGKVFKSKSYNTGDNRYLVLTRIL
jgi:hypothetical protein